MESHFAVSILLGSWSIGGVICFALLRHAGRTILAAIGNSALVMVFMPIGMIPFLLAGSFFVGEEWAPIFSPLGVVLTLYVFTLLGRARVESEPPDFNSSYAPKGGEPIGGHNDSESERYETSVDPVDGYDQGSESVEFAIWQVILFVGLIVIFFPWSLLALLFFFGWDGTVHIVRGLFYASFGLAVFFLFGIIIITVVLFVLLAI